MERFYLIICSICVSTVLGLSQADEDMILTHFPQELFLHPGRTAQFTCNVSSLYYMPSDINWYKTNDNLTVKIADLTTSNERIQISITSELKLAVIHIKNVSMDDSGNYHCQHVNVSGDKKIAKSGMSRLNVSDAHSILELSLTTPWKGTTDKYQSVSVKIAVICASIMTLLLLLLISIALILSWNQKRNKTPQPQVKHLKSPAQEQSVYSVDYGVLEFNSNPYRKSAEIYMTEQIEYASIVFPRGTPSLGEHQRKYSA